MVKPSFYLCYNLKDMKRVLLGHIINVRGLKGEVKIQSSTSFPAIRYKKGNKVILVNVETKEEKEVTVISFSRVGAFDYVKFEEITDIDQANLFRGYYVEYDVDSLPTLDGGYYYHQLLNLDVIDQNDNYIGKVKNIEEYPSSSCLRIKGEKEFLVPFVKDFIIEVNIEKKYIKINKMEGLI